MIGEKDTSVGLPTTLRSSCASSTGRHMGALDRHGATPHMEAFLREFGPCIERWEQGHASTLAPGA